VIRIYLGLCCLGLTGAALIATNTPIVEQLGMLDVVLATIGLHAHYTQE